MNGYSQVLVFALLHSVSAQQFVSSPPGFETKLGDSTSVLFGSGSFARFMMIDGEYRNQAMGLKGVSYRREGLGVSEARTWSDVTLHVSECVFDNVPITTRLNFASVPTTTPTMVYQGATTWPAIANGMAARWSVHFPFSSSWLYSGNQDICLDYEFTAGILASGTVPWWKRYAVRYALDGYPWAEIAFGASKNHGVGCHDSRNVVRSRMSVQSYSYNPDYRVRPNWANHHAFAAQSETGPNTTVTYALSLWGDSTGVTIPQVSCEKLFLDLTKPAVFAVRTTTASGWSQAFNPPFGLVPYDPRFVGVPFWIQAAWNDTGTGRMSLTPVVTSSFPSLPPYFRRRAIVGLDNPVQWGAVEVRNFHNPIARYEK